jgi:hypothetical protein
MVVGITGHQHIPPEARAHIASGIDNVLQPQRVELIGVCSLAVGADQLFAQAVLNLGGALHVVLPCECYDEAFSGPDLLRFRELLGNAARIETLAHAEPTEEAFLDAGHRVVDICDVLVAIWDGKPARGLGGTADVVDYARSVGREIVIIWPPGITR